MGKWLAKGSIKGILLGVCFGLLLSIMGVNNVYAEAESPEETVIRYGIRYEGDIQYKELKEEKHIYTFTTDSKDAYYDLVLDTSVLVNGVAIKLYDSNDKYIGAVSKGTSRKQFGLENSRNYRLEVYCPSGCADNNPYAFVLNVNDDPEKNSIDLADKCLEKGVPYTGNIVANEDVDCFYFIATADTSTIIAKKTDNGWGLTTRILNTKGDILKSDVLASKTEMVLEVPTQKGQKYYVTVYGNSSFSYGNEVDYSYTLQLGEKDKAIPSYTVPTGLKGICGNTLSTVKLSGGFVWTDSLTSVLYANTNKSETVVTKMAKFIPADTENYAVVENIPINIKVTHDTETVSNGNDTHSKNCKKCAYKATAQACSGGTATCKAKAKCSVCGSAYGEYAAHTLKTTTTKATLTEDGKKVTKCTVCDKVTKTVVIYAAKTIKLSKTTYAYDGKAKKPTVTVTDSKGNAVATTNFDVTYPLGRINVGKYTVKINFKSNYTGTKSLSFKINPIKTTISSLTADKKAFTVKWAKKTTQVTGYEIQYSTSSTFASGNKTVKVTSAKTVSKTISKLTGGKKYYVRIRTYKTVNKVNYYSDWSAKKAVTTKK
ncbi:MAG: fibronectin type III domain-containing protein [Lachnospiraceae bacterium]|nr:fibronectin type III domain-containing protein [Lachnospiraceae bacterium]